MRFDALPTCIGSFPHATADGVLSFLIETLPECPTWPQLPRRSPSENMYAQYATALPGARIDDTGRAVLDPGGDFPDAQTRFYADVLADEVDGYAPDPAAAAGYHALLGRLDDLGPGGFIKGHVTGPVSFGLTVTDPDDRPVLYDDTLRDVVVRGIAAQARAQVRQLAASGRPVILFVDEPYLSSFGSATIPVTESDVTECLDFVTTAIAAEGGLPGVHCCGNTDWSLLTATSARIISFDAYNYLEGLTLYPAELKDFFSREGALAWGVVPTEPEALAAEAAPKLADRLEAGLARLAETGLDADLLRRQCLVTPSCGTGTLSEPLAERAITLTRQVSDELRRRWRTA